MKFRRRVYPEISVRADRQTYTDTQSHARYPVPRGGVINDKYAIRFTFHNSNKLDPTKKSKMQLS